jgi:protein-S-isoprenylcysteine O-methyltransferase Ste14
MKTELALFAYFLAYFLAAFVWKSWYNYKKTGINPIVLPSTDDAYGYVARGFKLLLVALFIYLIALTASDTVRAASGELLWIEFAYKTTLAWMLMLIGLLTTIKAQSDMAESWRIGIDTLHKTKLATQGLFQYSRNPIFLSMRLSLLGAFLLIPNAVTLLFLCLGEVLMQTQTRLEETHLLGLHGDIYKTYTSRVRRWL